MTLTEMLLPSNACLLVTHQPHFHSVTLFTFFTHPTCPEPLCGPSPRLQQSFASCEYVLLQPVPSPATLPLSATHQLVHIIISQLWQPILSSKQSIINITRFYLSALKIIYFESFLIRRTKTQYDLILNKNIPCNAKRQWLVNACNYLL